MKPYGISYSIEGCICALCRSRGYRKGNAYGDTVRNNKHRARQIAKLGVKSLIHEAD